MKIIAKSGTSKNGSFYVAVWEDSNALDSLIVGVFRDNSHTINFRVQDTATNKSILISGTVGRDNKVLLNFINDGTVEPDNTWVNQCVPLTDITREHSVVSLDNLANTVEFKEI